MSKYTVSSISLSLSSVHFRLLYIVFLQLTSTGSWQWSLGAVAGVLLAAMGWGCTRRRARLLDPLDMHFLVQPQHMAVMAVAGDKDLERDSMFVHQATVRAWAGGWAQVVWAGYCTSRPSEQAMFKAMACHGHAHPLGALLEFRGFHGMFLMVGMVDFRAKIMAGCAFLSVAKWQVHPLSNE